jgi:hypothetical protein
MLGIPAGTVRSRLRYAMHELRRELEAGRVTQSSEAMRITHPAIGPRMRQRFGSPRWM